MDIVSAIVLTVLFWSFWFFISLPFAVDREQHSSTSFSGIKKPRIWRKFGFALVMGPISTALFLWAKSAGLFEGVV